jgi:hypothetical protein
MSCPFCLISVVTPLLWQSKLFTCEKGLVRRFFPIISAVTLNCKKLSRFIQNVSPFFHQISVVTPRLFANLSHICEDDNSLSCKAECLAISSQRFSQLIRPNNFKLTVYQTHDSKHTIWWLQNTKLLSNDFI